MGILLRFRQHIGRDDRLDPNESEDGGGFVMTGMRNVRGYCNLRWRPAHRGGSHLRISMIPSARYRRLRLRPVTYLRIPLDSRVEMILLAVGRDTPRPSTRSLEFTYGFLKSMSTVRDSLMSDAADLRESR